MNPGMADRRKCPECGVNVKIENLPAHYEKQHPRAQVPEKLTQEATQAARVAKQTRRPPPVATSSERRLYLAGGVIVVIVVVAAVLLAQSGLFNTSLVGKPAPGFTLTSSDGGTVSLSQYLGRVVLLDFMATTCTFCQQFTQNTLVPLHNGADGSKFVILSIDINKERDDLATGNARINTFKTNFGSTWTYALDVTRELGTTYNVKGTPAHYIVDRSGNVVDFHEGYEAGGDLTARLSQYW